MGFQLQHLQKTWLKSPWLSVLVGLNFSIVAMVLGRQVMMRERSQFLELIQSESQVIEVALKSRLGDKILTLEHMGDRLILWSEQVPNLWQTDSKSYLKSFPYLLALARVDPDFQVISVIPTFKTDNVTRLNDQIKLQQQRVITQSKIFAETQISDRVELNYFNQTLNGGLLVYVPLFKDQIFQGWLVAVIDVDCLFNKLLTELAQIQNYHIVLVEDGNKIYNTNPPKETGKISPQQIAYTQILPVEVAGASWKLEIIPSSKILREHYSYLSTAILCGGIPISGLLGFMVYLLQGRTRQLNDIQQLNRALTTLSECNQALVRAKTEQELLSEICQILIKIGGFQQVRVGYVQPDDESINWVAYSRAEGSSNLACCQALFNNRDSSITTVLQTGMYNVACCLIDSLQQNVIYRANFPLIRRKEENIEDLSDSSLIFSEVFGVLVLESTEKEAFEKSKISLLQELADDLTYGIINLRTRQARRESEEKFRQIAENVEDVFFVHSLNPPQMLYINPAYEKIWGRSCQEIYQRYDAWFDDIHPDDQKLILEKFTAFMNSGEFAGEYRIIRPDGEVRWILSKTFPLSSQEGEVYRTVGIAQDITAHKQAEEQLSKLSERLQLAIKSGEIGIWEWDIVNNILTWDKRMYELYGVELSNFSGVVQAWKQSLHEDDRGELELLIEQVLKGEKDYDTEFRVVHPDGSIRYIKADALIQRNQTGEPLRMVGINYDITSRKHTEIALKEQKELLQNIVDNIPVMIVLMDSQSNFIWVNREWEKVSGYQFEEISQFDVWADAFPDPEYRQYLAEKLQAEFGSWVDMKVRVRDGKLTDQTWMNITLFDGKIIGIGQDITERKRDEEKLRESENRLRQVLENMSVMLDAFDEEGNIIAWNKACEKISGYTADEIIGNPDAVKLLYPEENYRKQMIEDWNTRGNNYYDWEWNLTAKDGKIKTISWTNISDIYPVPGWSSWGVGIDVTSRKQSEEKQRLLYKINQAMTAAEDLDQALEIALSFICESISWDYAEAWIPEEETQRLELCSHFYSNNPDLEPFFLGSKNLTFRQNEGVPGRVWATQKPEWLCPLSKQVDSVYVRRALAESVQLETALAIPIQLETKIVAIFIFYSQKERERDQHLIELVYSLGNQLAITLQRRRIEQDIRELNQRLEERVKIRTTALEATNQALQEAKAIADAANQAKSTFLAQMSHELRTPLNGILGYSQILQQDKSLTPQQKQSLATIQKCGEHLLDLINDILDLAKIEAKKMDLHPTSVWLHAFLEEIVAIFRIKAEEKGLSWTYLGDSQLSYLHCLADKKRLRQVLLNLLSNAIKFTEIGQVIFAVEVVSPIANSSEFVTLRFKVEDTGIGIPDEDIDRLFQPFEQGTEAYKQSEGTGLGLTITQKLLEMMETKLEVESQYNRGSLFRFYLQLPILEVVNQGNYPSKVSKIVTGVKGRSPKILVVDDKMENIVFLQDFLLSIGFRVEIANNGRAGLEKINEFHPDLAIIDIVMPEMGGLEMIEVIRHNSTYKNLKIIASSASVFSTDQALCFEAGSDAFLTKPVEIQDLLKKLEDLLKIEWIYREDHQEDSSSDQLTNSADQSEVDIDNLLLENLYELALDGNIKQIKQQALDLIKVDSSSAAFAEALLRLANNFQEKEICQLIEKYRSQNHE
ncbi:PAS domain S-box protein [Limnoraphis robusta]|uniref:PAS domain S-box protein n=1 Tax=Limnoraphis robusta TaxID=1118279 RepID=UPI00066E5C92|nr:PAS domain S-box protein [Limnoraphis robusta]